MPATTSTSRPRSQGQSSRSASSGGGPVGGGPPGGGGPVGGGGPEGPPWTTVSASSGGRSPGTVGSSGQSLTRRIVTGSPDPYTFATVIVNLANDLEETVRAKPLDAT